MAGQVWIINQWGVVAVPAEYRDSLTGTVYTSKAAAMAAYEADQVAGGNANEVTGSYKPDPAKGAEPTYLGQPLSWWQLSEQGYRDWATGAGGVTPGNARRGDETLAQYNARLGAEWRMGQEQWNSWNNYSSGAPAPNQTPPWDPNYEDPGTYVPPGGTSPPPDYQQEDPAITAAKIAAEEARQAREAAEQMRQQSAKAYIQNLLDLYGLGGLAKQAWTWIQDGATEPEVLQKMRETQIYKDRFPAMAIRKNAGLAPIDEGTYVELERRYAELASYYQLPTSFYDQASDFTELIGSNRSPEQMAQIFEQGYVRVTQTAPEVRAAFARYYGVQGDAALAALYIDPDRGAQTLIRMASVAVAGGIAEQADINLSLGLADRIAEFNPSVGTLRQNFGAVNQLRPVQRESVSETTDITMEDMVGAQFGFNNPAYEDIQRRIASRQSAFRGGGSAAATSQGFIGFGAE